ncbi:hypothetical protein [Flammeovirga sp. SubArs3]|uniref:hypothetical protein n=1 Tax=Flammeovirga sp. SubArs3 TaxID=2995316 RepID=UPI00248D181A|nr:hypothetical protein [Flammeovirga sp. SubArs3]
MSSYKDCPNCWGYQEYVTEIESQSINPDNHKKEQVNVSKVFSIKGKEVTKHYDDE